MNTAPDAEPIGATESVDILSLRPGVWRKLATTIDLGEGKISKFNPTTSLSDETSGPVVIEEGKNINVFGEDEVGFHGNPLHKGWVRIKVGTQKNNRQYSVQVPVEALQGKKIDVFVR